MTHQTTRRTFLKAATATAAFSIIPQNLARSFAANEKVNMAIVGVAGQGGVNREWLARLGCNIVALCDPDSKSVNDALKAHPDAKTYADFREMLEKQSNIDAVMISGPDHMHYPASLLAMKLGKHVCTEKPLTHSVWEARQLGIAAKKYKVATQHDHESHALDGLRTLVEWVKSGAIGPVREVHIWSDRPIWPQGISKRPPAKPVPPTLNWDLWLGPAPYREYHDGLHPFNWRGYWDFGCGALGDMGCHFWDSAFWALDLFAPSTIEAEQQGNSAETGPNWAIITYQFPARGSLPPCTVKWYDGKKLPARPEELEADRKLPSNGSLFVGDKGKILVNDAVSPRIIPESKMQAFERPKPFIPRVGDHKVDWLNAIKGGPPAGSDFTLFGGPLAEVVLLGNVAIRTGKKLDWDHANLKATNAPEADQYIKREYRKGWEF
ncbi:MAG: Gfo/Idh/MocA family oxidoreductase [Planctomycetota bacterium]|nr:Gfo/Idh/MocA family oxidoreductase [Planctomycetota bacterium]